METVETFMTTAGSIVTGVLGWAGQVLDFVVENPVILVPALGFFLVGGAVGIFQRVFRG